MPADPSLSVLARATKADIVREPFPYVVLRDALEPSLFEQLELPGHALFRVDEPTRIRLGGSMQRLPVIGPQLVGWIGGRSGPVLGPDGESRVGVGAAPTPRTGSIPEGPYTA
jgi:hypothetical protein